MRRIEITRITVASLFGKIQVPGRVYLAENFCVYIDAMAQKPRYRVRAWTKPISMAEYFWLGVCRHDQVATHVAGKQS